jgi:hypothetical protein
MYVKKYGNHVLKICNIQGEIRIKLDFLNPDAQLTPTDRAAK